MSRAARDIDADFVHLHLPCGVDFAADVLPKRDTVAIVFRMLSGLAEEPPELAGVGHIVERTLSKGTRSHTGQELADAFDALGAQQFSASGRQSMLVRALCMPEFTLDVVDLVAEMVCTPTFPDDACRVAVDLAKQELRSVDDDPGEVVRMMIQRVTLGPVLGREPSGELETLDRITPDDVRAHWQRVYHGGRLQVTAAGPVDADALAKRIEARFAGLGSPAWAGREPAAFTFVPARLHRPKDLKQQHIAITLPGARREDRHFAVEQVLVSVLSGGMSGRLFTEVREKQGLVYWVAAWHEQPRGAGIVHLRASSTPERCGQTYRTLLREIERLTEDLTEEEVARARNGLVAQWLTQDDVTRSRVAGLSEDLFYFGRPLGLSVKLDAIRGVTLEQVAEYARRFGLDQTCVATLGPAEL